jgi:hypothetical protein
MRSIRSARAFVSIGTASFSFRIIRSRNCSCTTMTSFASVNSRLQKVNPTVVFRVVWCGQQRGERQKSFLTQMRALRNFYLGGFRQQHPHRNLQPSPRWVDDGDRAVPSLRSSDDLKGSAMERVERIKNLNVRRFCAQGIASADGTIPMSTVSFPPAASLQTVSDGSTRDTLSSCL